MVGTQTGWSGGMFGMFDDKAEADNMMGVVVDRNFAGVDMVVVGNYFHMGCNSSDCNSGVY